MPTYVYRREDGTTFEIEQPITASALETCPTTGQSVRRVISGSAGLIFKGNGFYLTDYVRKGKGGDTGESGGSSAQSGDNKAESSKPEAGKAEGGKAEGAAAKPSSASSDAKS